MMIDARRPMVAAFLLSVATSVCAVACAAGTADTGTIPDLSTNASPTDPSASDDGDKSSTVLGSPTPAADPDAGKKTTSSSSSTSSSSGTSGATSSTSSSSSSGTSGATSSTSSSSSGGGSSSTSSSGGSSSSSTGGTSSSSSSSGSSSGGTCIDYADPTTTSTICHACGGPSKPCQPNGCYNGYWCDELFEQCVAPTPPGC